MRRSWIVLFAGALGTTGAAVAQSPGPPDSMVTRLVDHLFDYWRGTDGPGCSVGVSRNGQTVYEHGYGMANLETGTPISPASIFHVASVSKQFTAMAIMLLARDGRLSIDDNIRKYLPEIPDYGTPITLRHLLTHTSGLRDQWELIGLARGRFEEDRITEADVMDIVPRQKALNFQPGAEYLYSNTGFTLLGVIVKRVSGKSLRDFADEHIFKPLGMTSTHFHDDYTMLVPGRTSAYERDGGVWHVGIPNFDTYGATSLFTTVGDLLKWEANFDHPIVGDRTVLDQMQTPAQLTSGDTTNYGLGLAIGKYRGARVVEHGGADAGYRSYVGRFPDKGLAIAIACNAATASTTALAHGVADAYLGSALAPVEAEVAPVAVTLSAEQLQKRVGMYVQPVTMQLVEVTLGNGHLTLKGPGRTLIPVSESRFRIAGQNSEITFGEGEHAGFERRSLAGGRPVAFEWRPSVVASPAMLSAYAGQYYSEELDARYRVTASDTTLALRTGTSDPLQARLVFPDTFDWNGNDVIQFTRTGGQVTGFEVTNGRMRRVKFARVPARRQ